MSQSATPKTARDFVGATHMSESSIFSLVVGAETRIAEPRVSYLAQGSNGAPETAQVGPF